MEDLKSVEEQGFIEHWFESILWSGRWTVLLAVVGGMMTATIIFYIATVDVYFLVHLILDYAGTSDMAAREELRSEGVGHAVEVIDGFLLAIVLLIFSYGIYELYVSKILRAYGTNTSKHLLKINSLDDLKARLGKVILMILVVKFFEVAVSMEFSTMEDLLLFSIAIILIGVTLMMNQLVEYLIHGRSGDDYDDEYYEEADYPKRRADDQINSVSGE